LHNSQALNSIASYEKNEEVQQADILKQQTLAFIFRRLPYLFSHLSIYQVNARELTAANYVGVISKTAHILYVQPVLSKIPAS